MANNKTTTARNEVLTFYLRPGDAAPTRPSALYLALFSADPGVGQTMANELSGNGYARQPIAFNAPSGGSAANSGGVSFGPATVGWAVVTHAAVCRSGTQGVADIVYGAGMVLSTPATVLINQTLDFAAGAITLSEA